MINKNYINDTKEINYKNFKDNILHDLCKDIEEMINRKIKSVEKTLEASIESYSLNYLEQINILKNELNSKNLIINKLLETVDKFTDQSSLNPEIQPIPQYNLENAGKSSNDVEDNITVSSVIYNERNSLLDCVTETITFEKNNQQQKEKHNISEHKSIEEQLNEVTLKKKEEYYKFKNNVNNNESDKNQNSNNGEWPKGTIAIIGDSIINGIMEEKLCGKGRNVKVRHFPGSTVHGMNHHLVPILRIKPSHLIIHVGANNASPSTSREILNKLLNLKSIAKDINPGSDVCLSTPAMRTDRGKKALTVSHLTNHLLQLEINIIDNRNITSKHLSRRGLHVNVSG